MTVTIHRILQAYRSGELSREDLFVVLARRSGHPDWEADFESLDEPDKAAFREWAIPLVTGQSMLFSMGTPAIDDAQLNKLRQHAKQKAWIS